MSKELVVTDPMSLLPTKEELDIVMTIAEAAVSSQYFNKLGGKAGIVMIALYAKEIGVPIVSALMGGMTNVLGKITIAPELMNSLIRQNGHKLDILESTDQVCKIKGTRKDSGESYTASFTIQDAQKAGLVKSGGGYDKYAQDMLFARCISRLRRRLFPDVACRSYVHGEIEEEAEIIKDEKTEEAVVVQEAMDLNEYITSEQAQEIEENIHPDDKEYRENLLEYFGKIPDFTKLPAKSFNPCIKAVKRATKMKEKTVEGVVLANGEGE